MLKKIILVLVCFSCFSLFFTVTSYASESKKVYNVLDYGAVPKLTSVSTAAIQKAIDACYNSGGGTVLFPRGHYLTGTLFLKSNVHYRFEKMAELVGSNSYEDYAELPPNLEEPQFGYCLLYARDVENITFSGSDASEINGRGYFFKQNRKRPKLMRIEGCKNIRFDDMTFKNSASWCLSFTECDSIFFYRSSIYNKENPNTDGMDFDACSNVYIKECNLQTLDDAIVLKSSVDKVCENYFIEDCTISSYQTAVKLGTSSKSGFRNVYVKNCQFFDIRYGAIKLLLVDGGILENVEMHNLKMYNCGGPIFLRLGNRGRLYDKRMAQTYGTKSEPEGRPVGILRNIHIYDIEARLSGKIAAGQGIMITGIPGYYIENVTFENMQLSYHGWGSVDTEHSVVPEDEAGYPEQTFFGELPSYGVYLRHVDNITMKNINITLRSSDIRPVMYLEDVKNSVFEDISFESTPKSKNIF